MERSVEMMRWLRALLGGEPKNTTTERNARAALLLAQRELKLSRRLRASQAKYDARLRGRP